MLKIRVQIFALVLNYYWKCIAGEGNAMLKRKAYDRFAAWKRNKTHQALLVTGARQVGKTYLIERFLENSYPRYIKFDLIDQKRVLASFKQAIDAEDLMLRISAAATTELVPGQTAIFIDEIQEYPDIVTHIKYLAQRDDFDFVFSGSLLGTQLKSIRSLPVGYVTEVSMFPLDFEEFCQANGLSAELFETLASHLEARSCVPDFLHERLLHLYHRYLLVGGMPDVVKVFLASKTLDPVRNAQREIKKYYLRDVVKYAPDDQVLTIQGIYNLIPSELSGHNRRFKLKNVPGVKRFDNVEDEFLWLTNAGIAISVNNATEPTSPLMATREGGRFKLYYSDVGLLCGTLVKGASLDLLDGRKGMNLGGVYENAVAQELYARGIELYYHSSRRIGELDFAFEHEDGTLVLIEVKSGGSYHTHAALDNAIARKNYLIDEAIVLAETNVRVEGAITYLPLYMTGLI